MCTKHMPKNLFVNVNVEKMKLIPPDTKTSFKILFFSFLWGLVVYVGLWSLFIAICDLWPYMLGIAEFDDVHFFTLVIVLSGVVGFWWVLPIFCFLAYIILMIRYNAAISEAKVEKLPFNRKRTKRT